MLGWIKRWMKTYAAILPRLEVLGLFFCCLFTRQSVTTHEAWHQQTKKKDIQPLWKLYSNAEWNFKQFEECCNYKYMEFTIITNTKKNKIQTQINTVRKPHFGIIKFKIKFISKMPFACCFAFLVSLLGNKVLYNQNSRHDKWFEF